MSIRVEGCKIDILVPADQTCGRWSLIRHEMPAFMTGPPEHYHRHFDQFFYVLEGTPTFVCDGKPQTLTEGMHLFVPRRIWHTVHNEVREPCAFLTYMAPAGFERFFIELAQIEGKATVDEIQSLALKHDEHYI